MMTSGELRARALDDLEKRPRGVMVDWAMHHAEACGRLAAAESKLKALVERDRDCRDALMRTYPPTAGQTEVINELAVNDGQLMGAREELAEATKAARFCEHVIYLLERRMAKPLAAVPGATKAKAS